MPYPVLVATHAGAWIAPAGGEAVPVRRGEAARAAADTPHLLVNAPLVAARLGLAECPGLDLLELFAFIRPARFAVPSAPGLAQALGLPLADGPEAQARFLQQAARRLLDEMCDPAWPARDGAFESALRLSRRGWGWATEVLDRLPPPGRPERSLFDLLPRFEEAPPRPPARVVPLPAAAVHATLDRLRGARREERPAQRAYAQALAHAFQPRETQEGPNLVAAEAGTGTGKTLGYLAPAALYAQETGGAVWLSTYTRALQRQLRQETADSLPPTLGGRPIVVRKGRENYLCLLNLEDAMQGAFLGRAAVFAELVARWARFTADGDMVGGDLPGWLPGLFRSRAAAPALTDRRGECIRAACPHWRCCFIERSVRAAAGASLVIANHALTMAAAARGGDVPIRILFDEGHHLFDAADSAFALALTGSEAVELRRWFTGPETGRRGG
ncbi:MAG: ATP-dependent DNA helicase, partial [Sphingomonadaceae bacterium]